MVLAPRRRDVYKLHTCYPIMSYILIMVPLIHKKEQTQALRAH